MWIENNVDDKKTQLFKQPRNNYRCKHREINKYCWRVLLNTSVNIYVCSRRCLYQFTKVSGLYTTAPVLASQAEAIVDLGRTWPQHTIDIHKIATNQRVIYSTRVNAPIRTAENFEAVEWATGFSIKNGCIEAWGCVAVLEIQFPWSYTSIVLTVGMLKVRTHVTASFNALNMWTKFRFLLFYNNGFFNKENQRNKENYDVWLLLGTSSSAIVWIEQKRPVL